MTIDGTHEGAGAKEKRVAQVQVNFTHIRWLNLDGTSMVSLRAEEYDTMCKTARVYSEALDQIARIPHNVPTMPSATQIALRALETS